jgi:hypothetical protein
MATPLTTSKKGSLFFTTGIGTSRLEKNISLNQGITKTMPVDSKIINGSRSESGIDMLICGIASGLM